MSVKKIISLCLVAALAVFGVPQYAAKAEAATTNYARAMADYGSVIDVTTQGIDATGNSDVGAAVTYLIRVLNREPREATTPIVLYFPSGKYKITDTIKIYATNVHIVAESDSVFTVSKKLSRGMLEIRDTSNVTVLGGQWNGNSKAKYGLMFNNSTDVTVSESNISKMAERGVHAINSTVTLNGIKSFNNTKYGISTANNANITVNGSSIYNNKEHGIVVADSILHMENGNNKIYKNGFTGISGNGSTTKMYISGNEITQNGTRKNDKGHGIGVADSAYAEISNNTLNSNKQCGISLINKANAVVTANTIQNNGRHGIGVAVSCVLTADGNTVTGNKWHGIMIRDKSTGTLTNNTLNSNKIAGLSLEKTSGTIELTGNTINSNKSNGIIVTSGKISLTNNTIMKNKAFGIYTDNATVTLVSGNVIKSNSKGDIDADGSKLKVGKDNIVKKIKK